MKRIFLFTVMIFCALNFFTPALYAEDVSSSNSEMEFVSPFKLNVIADSVLLAAGTVTTGISFYMDFKNEYPVWNGNVYNLDEVNAFDRWAARPYSKALDIIGTGTCAVSLISGPLLIAGQTLFGDLPKSEILTAGTMYVESFLLSYGAKEIMKRSALRVRPYMYFEGFPEDDVAEGDFQFSWPSGHTTNAFQGAAFAASMMAYYYPESKWRVPVTVASFSIAAATGVMRVLSGNHFITDVLTGAALGSFCGFIVPFIHHKLAQGADKKLSAVIIPNGMLLTYSF